MFIRRLIVERYRGIKQLTWDPPTRLNCLIGPGDSGKSMILSAIERVLDPRASNSSSEFDYYRRRVEAGFKITAVLGDLDDEFLSSVGNPPLAGWLDGEYRALPDEDGAEAVLVAIVTGSPEFDVSHELYTAGAAENPFFLKYASPATAFARCLRRSSFRRAEAWAWQSP